jgi:hypothetical protein
MQWISPRPTGQAGPLHFFRVIRTLCGRSLRRQNNNLCKNWLLSQALVSAA